MLVIIFHSLQYIAICTCERQLQNIIMHHQSKTVNVMYQHNPFAWLSVTVPRCLGKTQTNIRNFKDSLSVSSPIGFVQSLHGLTIENQRTIHYHEAAYPGHKGKPKLSFLDQIP